jgi:glycosyltransferase involved in cell wall biosynthesis
LRRSEHYTQPIIQKPLDERPRILLLVPHLGGGGAERVFALLASRLSGAKYEVHLGLITEAVIPMVAFPPEVVVHALGSARIRNAGFRVLALIRRLRPRVILSGMYHLNFLVLLLRPLLPRPTRVLVRQNGFVSAVLASGELPAYTRLFYRLLYRRADRVICQSATMADDMVRELGIRRDSLTVVANPIDVDAVRSAVHDSAGCVNDARPARNIPQGLKPQNLCCFCGTAEAVPFQSQISAASSSLWTECGPHLLAVGRLAHEKGFDLLLRALVTVREQFPDVDLTVLGSGPDEGALKGLCSELGIESAVRFAGYVAQPWAYFSGASAFVLSSRHEGMSNALLEAAAAGLPLVALPAAGGVAELLCCQRGAWVATDVSAEALSASLRQALQTLQPGERFVHDFIEPFRLERAICGYEQLIDATMEEHPL